MTRFGLKLTVLMLVLVMGRAVGGAEATNRAPDFREVYELVRTNIAGMSQEDLNRAAVQGLVTALGSRVSLISGATNAPRKIITATNVFDGDILYLRVAGIGEGLAKDVNATYQRLSASNKLTGIVIDLRYSEGSDYAAAVAVADLFTGKVQPLLNWGAGVVSSQEKPNPIRVPVAVLVNSVTVGAPEALAAMLRETGVGLILGSRTAGQAMVGQNFPLSNGQQLHIATAPVTLGNGAALSSQGIKPDIEVAVTPENERAYYADAFVALPRPGLLASDNGSSTNQSNGTNTSRRVRFNEAELVREHREGLVRESEGVVREVRPNREAELDKPVVSDPVLARALDLLKGLAVVREPRR